MDKHMINIDDLVRQRLSGGEEQERPGAWLHMRDLLDQEMPLSGAAASFNWRRILGICTGLALLATVTVGSYQVMTSTRLRGADKAPALANTHPAGRSAGNDKVSSGIASVPSANTLVNNAARSVKSNTVSAINKDKPSAKTSTSISSGLIVGTVSPTATENKVQHNDIGKSLAAGKAFFGEKSTKTASTKATTAQLLPDNSAGLAINKSTGLPTAINAQEEPKPGNPVASSALTSSKNNSTKATGKARQNAIHEPADLNKPTILAADNTKVNKPAPDEPTLKKDSIQQLVILQRSIINPISMTGRYIIDTISLGRVAFDRNELLAFNDADAGPEQFSGKQAPAVAAGNPDMNPAAAAPPAKEDASNVLVPLSNFKVHSRKTNMWDAQRFDDVVRDIKFNLAQVRFYPGITAGYNNSLFASNGLSGFHLGLFGFFTFGEHLNFMAELKYFYRINNTSMQDNYFGLDSINTGGQQTFLQRKVEHFFKFSALQSLEMPLALRYAAGRVNLTAGLNLGYNFRINAEEIEHKLNEADTMGVKPAVAFAPSVNISDFNSRFSVGGLLGIGWQWTPSISLDLRMTKNFWDNAAGGGAQRVSQQYLRAPSFQVSIGYRFSQRNQIPKAQ